MGIHARRSAFARARVLLVALMVCSGVLVSAAPAHADNDGVEDHLCLDTGFGFYGVTDHAHITDTSGTYHISAWGQASAWTWASGANYCDQSSTNLACPTGVALNVYQNGNLIGSTSVYVTSGVHSVSTGTHSYGSSYANYLVEAYVIADFGNFCTSEAFGSTATTDSN